MLTSSQALNFGARFDRADLHGAIWNPRDNLEQREQSNPLLPKSYKFKTKHLTIIMVYSPIHTGPFKHRPSHQRPAMTTGRCELDTDGTALSFPLAWEWPKG